MKDDIKFILYIIDDNYVNYLGELNIDRVPVDWTSILKTAINNRILYTFSKSALTKVSSLSPRVKTALEMITKEGDLWLERFYNTLTFIKDHIGYQNFIIIKTFKFFQDITFDVDIVLVNDVFEQINILSKEANFRLCKINGGYELESKNKNYLSIDVYKDFLFEDKSIIDKDFICNRPRLYKATNSYYYIPSIESELLLYISQINFQLRFITLHEFFQITKMISKGKETFNWEKFLTEVTKYNWSKSFINTLSIISSLHFQLYGKQLNLPIKSYKNIKCRFPYFLSPTSIFKNDFEIFKYSYFKNQFIKDLRYYMYGVLSFYIRKRIPIYRDWINLNDLNKKVLR